MDIRLVQKEAAWQQLNNAQFIEQWKALCATCPWSLTYHKPSFLLTWYKIFQEKFDPILIYMLDKNGHISGLLPLAISKDKAVKMAGDYECEYQGWVCNQAYSQTFPEAALQAFIQAFPKTPLRLLYISNRTPMDWLHTTKVLKYQYNLQTLQNPVYHRLNAEHEVANWVAAKKKNKRTRSSINKLTKQGLTFKTITTLSEFEAIFSDLITMYEARLSSAYNTESFTKEPNKKRFWLALFKQGILHVTTSNIDNQIASFQINLLDGKTVYLGLLSHDAAYDQYSIGSIHMIYLIEQLAKEGYHTFEISPPAEGYKLRWSNKQVPVHTLTIYPSKLEGFSMELWLKTKDVVRPWIQPLLKKLRLR